MDAEAIFLPLAEGERAQLERFVQAHPDDAGNIQDLYPLTPLQEGLLFHHLRATAGDTYVVLLLFEFDEHARLQAFIDALQKVVGRHDALRTAVYWEGLPRPMQVVYRRANLPVEEFELDPSSNPDEQLREQMMPQRQRLDLHRPPLMRLKIARRPGGTAWFGLLQIHHLICDALSLDIVMSEVNAYLNGRGEELEEPVQYKEQVLQTIAQTPGAESFFRERLEGFAEPSAPFGLFETSSPVERINAARRPLDFAGSRLRAQARRQHVSVAALAHAAWAVVVAHTSGCDDVVFGTVFTGRTNISTASRRRVGLYLNTLPLRLRLGGATARDLALQTQRELFGLMGREHASLALARSASDILGQTPLFTTLFNFRRAPPDSQDIWCDAAGVRTVSQQSSTHYPISFWVEDDGNDFVLTAHTIPSLDANRVVDYMATALRSLVEALESAPQTLALTLSTLPASEQEQVLEQFNATQTTYPHHKLIHELFEEQVRRTPRATAVIFRDQRLTYEQLNHRADQLARLLRHRGVGPDQLVALCVERSPEMIIGLLGVLKAGGAYVPLDPHHPPERLRFVLGDCSPRVLLTQGYLRDALTADVPEVIGLDEDWRRFIEEESSDFRAGATGMTPHNLAYVIYTSGSTGTPKGVMVEHGGVVNFLNSLQRILGVEAQDSLLAVTTISFDIAALEIYLPLVSGARVVLAEQESLADPRRLIAALEEHGVTLMQATPASWKLLLSGGWSGRRELQAVCGGEALSTDLAGEILGRVGTLWNLYGPTETTIWSSCHQIGESAAGPASTESIGRPIGNTQIYFLDEHRRPVARGVVGELCIGGLGVARGYLNRAQLTAERFLADPFSTEAGARLYRTGDLGRWRADGTIEYLGRNDHQVKLRGFRIELGEIEARLRQCRGVKDTAVLAREDTPGEKRLVAYVVVADKTAAPNTEELRAHLKAALPDYMIPSAMVVLESFPLTPSGKLDRRALPPPEHSAYVNRRYAAPEGHTEEVLADIWSQMLQVARIGRHDDFFELGGHSLLGVRMLLRAAERLGAHLPPMAVFQYSTVARLAELVESLVDRSLEKATLTPVDGDGLKATTSAVSGSSLRPREPHAEVPLTFAQLWFWNNLDLERQSSMRSIVASAKITGLLCVLTLQAALCEVVRRHESLRTRIVCEQGVPIQRIDPGGDSLLELIELGGVPDHHRQSQITQRIEEVAFEPFRVAIGPLFRARLLHLADDYHVLVVATDHIVSDLASLDVLLRDLFQTYELIRLERFAPAPDLPLQFADFAVWQQQTDSLWRKEHEAYWIKRLAGARGLRFSADAATGGHNTVRWSTLPLKLDIAVEAHLPELCRQHRTTRALGLLAVFAALLFRSSGISDLVIPFTTLGRSQPETLDLVGFFAVPLFLRLRLDEADRFSDLLAQVMTEYATASLHEDACRIAAQQPEREFVWNPVFNWIPYGLASDGSQTGQLITETLRVESSRYGFTRRDAREWGGELRVDLADMPDGITAEIRYRTDRLTAQFADGFAQHFNQFATRLVHEPGTRVNSLSYPASYKT